jgi:hypothetical protein
MYFNLVCDRELPKLAWLAIVEQGHPDVTVIHGEWVETGKNFFFEGVWNSSFAGGNFDSSGVLFGSGAKLRGNEIVFCTPSHTLSRINFSRKDRYLLVSNSFVFCMTALGSHLRADYALYFRDFQSIVRGLKKYRKRIPLKFETIQLLYVDNLMVGSNLALKVITKPQPPAFASYTEYYNFLVETIQQIKGNAEAPNRSVKYGLASTISTGYDSPASAALGRIIGCRQAISFRQARMNNLGDSGWEIGRHLGYSVVEADRLAYQRMNNFPEAEFVATGTATNGGDVIFAPFEEFLKQRIITTGFNGGGDMSGSLMEEFRLRVGFIHMPIPFMGAVRQPELLKISNSNEMKPWILGKGYDRPIPRRIVEEAGVPRELFGQTKKAVGARMFDRSAGGPEYVEPYMSPNSYRDYREYYERNHKNTFSEKYYWSMHLLRITLVLLSRGYNKLIATPPGMRHFYPKALMHYNQPIGKNWVMFHWGAGKIAFRYKTKLMKRLGSKWGVAI